MKAWVVLVVLSLVALFTLQAQTLSTKNKKAIELYNNADNYRVRGQYPEAINMLHEAIQKDKEFEEAYYRLAITYKAMGDIRKATEAYERGLLHTHDVNRKMNYWYDLADVYLKQGEYQKSFDYCTQFQGIGKTDIKRNAYINLWKSQAEFSIASRGQKSKYKISPLSDTVNKFPMQYFPVITADNQQLIFTARFGGGRNENEDIMLSERAANGSWSFPKSLSGNINTVRREGACTISADGRHLIFTVCGERGCDLFESRKQGNIWSAPRNLGPNINSTSWDAQPSLSADGNELYFVSDRKGGVGGYDIWYSKLDKSGWSKAQNLGPSVNTIFDEISPYIHVNNKTLYVVSNGYPGYGGYDIYYVNKLGSAWSTPKNMGNPLNDHFDQYSFVVSSSGSIAYYSREESKNKSRLYQIQIPEELVVKSKGNVIKGVVADSKTSAPLDAVVELFDLGKRERVSQVTSDSVTGEYLAVLPGGAEYALYVSREGYLFQSLHFNYTVKNDSVPLVKNVALQKIEKDASIVLNNLFFDFDKYELREESFTELTELVNFLTAHPELNIEIRGHTDNLGKEEYNQNLSLLRATAVAEFLQKQGISASRLRVNGYGSRIPLAPNNTEDNRALNRRIDFRVIQ